MFYSTKISRYTVSAHALLSICELFPKTTSQLLELFKVNTPKAVAHARERVYLGHNDWSAT